MSHFHHIFHDEINQFYKKPYTTIIIINFFPLANVFLLNNVRIPTTYFKMNFKYKHPLVEKETFLLQGRIKLTGMFSRLNDET